MRTRNCSIHTTISRFDKDIPTRMTQKNLQ